MTMIGVDCEMRQSWNKTSDDHFSYVNEEQLRDASWSYIDEWEFKRR